MNKIDFEKIIYDYVSHIKLFDKALTEKYELKDSPYNVVGKLFPRIGSLFINSLEIRYRFHGRGATLFWGEVEIWYDIEIENESLIIISHWALEKFLETYFGNLSLTTVYDSDSTLNQLEAKGVFIKRNTKKDLFIISEAWYAQQHQAK